MSERNRCQDESEKSEDENEQAREIKILRKELSKIRSELKTNNHHPYMFGTHLKDLGLIEFDAKSSSAFDWMEQFEKACEGRKVSNFSEKRELLQKYLAKNAKSWYNSCLINKLPEEWQIWKENFLKSFSPSEYVCLRDAIRFRYADGPLTDYYYEKERLLIRVFKNDPKTITLLIIEGLPEYMAREAMKLKPENGTELLDILKTMKARDGGFAKD